MTISNDNEVMIGRVVYVFTSAGLAKAFEACLSTGTLASCGLDYPPLAIHPPAKAHAAEH